MFKRVMWQVFHNSYFENGYCVEADHVGAAEGLGEEEVN
jgi:hypothetical protein